MGMEVQLPQYKRVDWHYQSYTVAYSSGICHFGIQHSLKALTLGSAFSVFLVTLTAVGLRLTTLSG